LPRNIIDIVIDVLNFRKGIYVHCQTLKPESTMTRSVRLVIADDHAMFRRGVITVVSRMNVRFVAEASNGQELLDKIEALDELPHICILDVNMPVMDGLATLKSIKSRWPHISVLMLTMLDSEATARNMLRAGAAGYLLKDGPPAELENAIRSIIEAGIYESEFSKRAIATNAASSKPELELTEQELEFLSLCCLDLSYAEIALRMGLLPNQIEGFAVKLSARFNVKSRVGLIQSAMRLGLMDTE
jgi:DNA-binding NarL/FixJ family response regulator